MGGTARGDGPAPSRVRFLDRRLDPTGIEEQLERVRQGGGTAVSLYPSQWEFVNDTSHYSMNGGGFGSGKTVGLVVKCLRTAQEWPGIPILIGRRHMPMAKLTTLKELQTWLPPSWLRHYNKSTATWELKNGSVIQGRPVENWKELQGLNVGASFLDEVAEIPHAAWKTVCDRTRVKHFPCTVNMVTNPGPRTHYLFKEIVQPARRGEPGFFYVQASSLENLSTSERFRTSILQRYAGDELEQAVYGEWGNPSGRVWSNMGRHNLVPAASIDWSKPYRFERSLDFGFEHNFVCLWWAWQKVRVGHHTADVGIVFREYAAKRLTLREHATAIYAAEEPERRGGIKYRQTWLEWANQDRHELASLENELLRITGAKAEKARIPGHRAVQGAFLPDASLGGWARVYISSDCPDLWEEAESYSRPEGATREDQVVEFREGESIVDRCDAFRYGYHSHVYKDFEHQRGYDPGATESDRAGMYELSRGG